LAAVPPIAIGFVFLILGSLLASWLTRGGGGSARRRLAARNPFLAMFLTGLWIGLMLGGLGIIFHASPLTGVFTGTILIAARFLTRRPRSR